MKQQSEISYGFCHCGCGERTNLATQNQTKYGHIRGEPFRYIRGHNHRRSPVAYVEQDCGFETPCWIWQRGLQKDGYGRMKSWGIDLCAHRVYYERAKGPIPEGLQIDHLCRTRACVNPEHLEPVTCAENTRRGANTKLVLEQVKEIKRLVKTGEMTLEQIAERFGVSRPAISLIKSGKRWVGA